MTDPTGKRPITIVGVGPGAVSYMTQAAIDAVFAADTIAAGGRLIGELRLNEKTKCIELPASGMSGAVCGVLEGALREGSVVLAVSGDPGFYSLARKVIAHFGRDMVEVIPGISSLQLMAARLGRSWVNVATESLHGREYPEMARLASALASSEALVLLLGASDDAARHMKWLASDPKLGGAWAAVGWDLGLPKEQVFEAECLANLIRCPYVGRLALLWLERGDCRASDRGHD